MNWSLAVALPVTLGLRTELLLWAFVGGIVVARVIRMRP